MLASNTSSISITALANGLKRPGRLVGMHFFNPVPLMKLVEVVSGLQTDVDVAAAIFELSKRWGKTPVHARSTPGFIVNRIARPYYAEALSLLHERFAEPATIDACLRGAGFRMGPCELMDLIGHDTNFAVTQSVYDANFGDKRYVPSLVQREMVDGGLLGRKSGRGFFAYGAAGAATPAAAAAISRRRRCRPARSSRCTAAASPSTAGRRGSRRPTSASRPTRRAAGTACRPTPASCASATAARRCRSPPTPAFAISPSSTWRSRPPAARPARRSRWRSPRPPRPSGASTPREWLRIAGWQPQVVGDAPGLVVARTVAMLINEGADAVQQGVCTPEGADLAMKLGVNHPAGPFEFLARWDALAVATLLGHLDAHYRGERYRVSPWLRERAWLALLGPSAA